MNATALLNATEAELKGPHSFGAHKQRTDFSSLCKHNALKLIDRLRLQRASYTSIAGGLKRICACLNWICWTIICRLSWTETWRGITSESWSSVLSCSFCVTRADGLRIESGPWGQSAAVQETKNSINSRDFSAKQCVRDNRNWNFALSFCLC